MTVFIKMPTVFKVVTVSPEGKLWSYNQPLPPRINRVYAKGKWTNAPRGTYLFAFYDEQRAIEFARYNPQSQIWKAEAKRVQPAFVTRYMSRWFTPRTIHGLKATWSGKRFPRHTVFDRGTVFCKSIKLTRRIK